MSALGKILGTFALGHGIDHDGVAYFFGRIDHAKAAELEQAYFKRARDTVHAIKGELSEAAYERQLDRVTDKYNQGRFAFPVGESFSYYLSGGGLPDLVAALTGCERRQAEKLVEARTVEVMHVVLCVVCESFPDFKKKILQAEAAGGKDFETLAALLATSGQ